MTNESKKAMARIRRKLTRWERLSLTACGYEGPMRDAISARFDAEHEIEGELDRLEGELLRWQDRGPG